MIREVSLFNGIPHGWTVDDPESFQARAKAYNAMVDGRTGIAAMLPPGRVPRIPSVVFKQNALFTPDSAGLFPLQRAPIDGDDWSSDEEVTLPPLMKGLGDGTLSGEESMLRVQMDSGDTLPLSLQPFKVTSSQAIGRKFIAYAPEIDPTLLEDEAENGDTSSGETDSGSVGDAGNTEELVYLPEISVPPGNDHTDAAIPANMPFISLNLAKPTLFRRTAAPPPLELANIRSSPNFTNHRNAEHSSPTTPGSAGSCYSQLSFQTGSATSTDPSPFTTALPTPTDEHQKTAMELAQETGGLVLGAKDIGDTIIEHPWEQEAEFPTMMNLAQLATGGVHL
jgi:hypothetical protein